MQNRGTALVPVSKERYLARIALEARAKCLNRNPVGDHYRVANRRIPRFATLTRSQRGLEVLETSASD